MSETPPNAPKAPSRRALLLGAGLVAATPTLTSPALASSAKPQTGPALPPPESDSPKALTRIAFGSCAKESKAQPIWDAIAAQKPDLMLMLGDNVYLDTRDVAVMKAKYAQLAEKPEFRRFRDQVPILATWDDHDYGENDAGADYPMKAASRTLFCDFFGVPADSARRRRPDGIYAACLFGPAGQRVQILLPDLRWNRTPIPERDFNGAKYEAWATKQALLKKPVPGPYERTMAPAATMLGETQWQWLEAELHRPADVRILASSLQVVADFPGWEAWSVYGQDTQRLIQAIRTTRADGLICLSGDTHYAEFSRLDVNVPYPLWDFTSSGLTETWPVLPPNDLRVGEAYRDNNFGLITLDWTARTVTVAIHDKKGEARLSQTLPLSTLAHPPVCG